MDSSVSTLDRRHLLARVAAFPWYIPAVLFASTSVVVGVLWDISWHRTIGRDTFWTPAHLAIYLGGIVAGGASGWLVLRTTFARAEDSPTAGVRFWGFRGPLGAWVAIWGAMAMITSAPLDNWWHDAYGLDVEILSPPHTILAAGIAAIQLGALLLVVSQRNRERDPAATRALSRLFCYGAGLTVLTAGIMATEEVAFPNQWHSSTFYQVCGGIFPIILVATARAAQLRWAATTTAAVYMGASIVVAWGLQLFPAQPMLAPTLNPVTRMVPQPFPLALVAPALALDVLLRKAGPGRDWRLSLALGVAFTVVLLAVHWFFAEFLLSPWARNFVFFADQWGYDSRLGPWRYEYWDLDGGADAFSRSAFARGVGIATAIAIASSRLGLWWGRWMARVQR